MSVKVHEAYSLDSQQDRLLWWDDFLGDQLQDEWRTIEGGGGTVAVVDAQTGGIIRLSTPTASDNTVLDWNDIRTLHINKKVTAEVRVRANGGVVDTTRTILRLQFDGDNLVDFWHTYDSTVISMRTRNGGVQTTQNADVALDGDTHIYRVECFPTGEVHFYIDGTEQSNSPITTNIPDDAGDYLELWFRCLTNADTDPATSMDIDYCVVRQEI